MSPFQTVNHNDFDFRLLDNSFKIGKNHIKLGAGASSNLLVMEIGCGGVEQCFGDLLSREIEEFECGCGQQSVTDVSHDSAREILEIGCACGQQSVIYYSVTEIGCGGEQSGNDSPQEIVEIGCGGGQQSVNQIPGEIVEEIFANLPVKSLMKFRCISKSWRGLIGSKRFVNKHLENSKRRGVTVVKDYCSIISDLKCYDLRDPLPKAFDPLEGGWIIGCCNGVQCILNWRRFVLLNPATRTSVTLPLFDFCRETATSYGHKEVRCGFGWDEESDAYKVFVCNNDGQGVTFGKVYSSKTDSWKKVDCGRLCFLGAPDHIAVGVLLSGKIHWVPERERDGDSICADFIEYFDVKSEVFGRIKLPSEPEGGVGRWWLKERDGCLTAFYNHNDDDKGSRRSGIRIRSLASRFPNTGYMLGRLPQVGKDEEVFDVWVMEEYGVESSWVKKSTNIPFLKSDLECQQYVYVESLISPATYMSPERRRKFNLECSLSVTCRKKKKKSAI